MQDKHVEISVKVDGKVVSTLVLDIAIPCVTQLTAYVLDGVKEGLTKELY